MGLEHHVKVLCPACVPRRSSGGPVVILRLLEKWNKEVNKVVMEYLYISKTFDEKGKPIWGYRKRMFRDWRERGGMFESTEQCVCNQERAIRMNG